MSYWIYPYKTGSNSVEKLSEALGARVIKREGSRYREGLGKLVINWGASDCPYDNTLNKNVAVQVAANKKATLEALQVAGVRTPQFTTESDIVDEWLNNRELVLARSVLTGSGGMGITILDRACIGSIPDARLYTLYIPKANEYRVHVANKTAIHIQRKLRNRSIPDESINWKIRNSSNGFVFSSNVDTLGDVPQDIVEQSIDAVDSLGLDFGAVDVVLGRRDNLAYVLEVNTAPGIEGVTLDKYVEYIRRVHENI